ncbi:NAD(P)/FAD-dependent oxidoreductase, partial [Albidovulum sp.]
MTRTASDPGAPGTGTDLLVIGAGVIGLSVALAAQARGRSVLVIDRAGPAAGASAGNAGGFAFPEITPLATPETLLSSPKWLLDPLGPLAIPPRYAARLAPWMLRFARECLPGRVAASTRAQAALMRHARATLEPLMALAGAGGMLRKTGQIRVYESRRAYERGQRAYREAANHGFTRFRLLATHREIAQIQPGLSPRFVHGILTEDWWAIADPKLYTLALAEALTRGGGRIDIAQAQALAAGPEGEGVTVHLADGTRIAARQAVVAAGAHSHLLAASLGDRIPLEAERGYNTTLPA